MRWRLRRSRSAACIEFGSAQRFHAFPEHGGWSALACLRLIHHSLVRGANAACEFVLRESQLASKASQAFIVVVWDGRKWRDGRALSSVPAVILVDECPARCLR